MIKAALCQVNPTVGDIQGNMQIVLEGIRKAKALGCELAVFPELVITGYPPEDLLFYPQFIRDNLRAIELIKKHTTDIAVVLGYVDVDSKKKQLFNAAGFLYKRQCLAVHRKVELPNYGVFDEKRYFSKGEKATFVRFKGLNIALTICEDIWIKDGHVYQKDYLKKSSLIINISASPYEIGKIPLRAKLISELSKKSKTTVIYNNLVGGQDELVFDGSSLIANPIQGRLMSAKSFAEDFLVVDIYD